MQHNKTASSKICEDLRLRERVSYVDIIVFLLYEKIKNTFVGFNSISFQKHLFRLKYLGEDMKQHVSLRPHPWLMSQI